MLHQRTYAFEPSARGPYAIVYAVGELDIAAVGEMRTAVRCAARRAPHVVVDLRPATFMDTFALQRARRAERGGGSPATGRSTSCPARRCSACSTSPARATTCAGSRQSS